ncbi:SIR2 family protein [Dyella sp. Tek66A03]|uniref:SIR2 family protein n=1 Tax=Dyella sp. Tek66A03 TaxID=3458298 RepID=UPI00403E5162
MTFSAEIETFIKDFVNDLREDCAAVFAGAGMSKAVGYVDWPELLRDIADELQLKVELEHDLISLAQFHVNSKKNAAKLTKKIIQEFSDQAELSPTHRVLARLPIKTYWTTNYDALIETALAKAYKVADVKFNIGQLHNTRPKRDAVVYKMHGDVTMAQDAVLYKEQYEQYHRTHEAFITALSGDLVSKTFLFIGFSFTDPNLDYVLSRLHAKNHRNHYCFMRIEHGAAGDDADTIAYKRRKQALRVEDLKRFGIQTLMIDDYEDIPRILEAVEIRYRKKTVFISGSAEVFEPWSKDDAQQLIHKLSAALVKRNYQVITGFGWGVGSAVINGALEAIYEEPGKHSEDQLIMRPFPQVATNDRPLDELWNEYRHRMIALAGIAIFVFGNKRDRDGQIVAAEGVRKEFQIALEHQVVPLPVGATGFMAKALADDVLANGERVYLEQWMVEEVQKLNVSDRTILELVDLIVKFADKVSR